MNPNSKESFRRYVGYLKQKNLPAALRIMLFFDIKISESNDGSYRFNDLWEEIKENTGLKDSVFYAMAVAPVHGSYEINFVSKTVSHVPIESIPQPKPEEYLQT